MRARMLGVAALASLALAAPAEAGSGSGNGQVTVDVAVTKFALQGRQIVGRGTLTARVADASGNVERGRRNVRFAFAAQEGRCRVLTLRLDELRLDLLGVRVDASTINLRLFAIPRGEQGGVLGKLFCALARSTLRLRGSIRAATHARRVVRSLNSRLERRPMRAFRTTAILAPGAQATQQQPSCSVLTLVLGPLDLNLLGLVVELYGENPQSPVTLVISAFPGQGALGDLFCQLSGGPR